MYKSPIDIIYGQMETQLEGTVLKAVQKVGVDVDKDELIRALQYDRDQYNKGYDDAMRSVPTEKGKTMNKRGWTIEQILELTENLYKHHEDYGQGRTQNFHTVCLNCKYAAEIITQLLDKLKANDAMLHDNRGREKLIEILRVPIYPHERADPAEVVADYLLDNGVTVGKPSTEYLHPVDNYAGLKGKYLNG